MTTQTEQDSQLPARERAELLVERVLENQQIWGLMGADGWVMVENGEQSLNMLSNDCK